MSEPYDRGRWERDPDAEEPRSEVTAPPVGTDDVEEARENVFDGWPSAEDVGRFSTAVPEGPEPALEPELAAPSFARRIDEEEEEEPEAEVDPMPDHELPPEPDSDLSPVALVDESDAESDLDPAPDPDLGPVALVDPDPVSHEHAPGELEVPPGYGVLEGVPDGRRRAVAVVVARFNGEITAQLLASALDELDRAGVSKDAVTVMPVPGAFELPIGAMALARTRRFACVVALGCVIRGDTPHFDYVASEAASGLQLAALETGVPVAFGVLTVDVKEQALARISKGAEAVRTALEMADAFAQLRASAR
jgi:6,7-dimethyl-8-ribityllumazine synthase